MKQSRGASLTESVLNVVVGFGIGLLAQLVFLPWLGVAVTLGQNLAFAAIMTVISIARSYGMRRLFEALHIRVPLSPFARAVIAERRRQVEVEGWTLGHDDAHAPGELAQAGAAYAVIAAGRERFAGKSDDDGEELFATAGRLWPWQGGWFKPQDFRRDLVRAGSLILAEGERHDRGRRRKG